MRDNAGEPNLSKNQPFAARLGFAVSGIAQVTKRERSFRSQLLLALLVLAEAGSLRPPFLWWALLALSIGVVLALECVNAALEYALDALHPDFHPAVGCAKDAAAGAVLIASLASACVGGLMILTFL